MLNLTIWLFFGVLGVLALALGNDPLRLVGVPVFAVFLLRMIEYLPTGWTGRLPKKLKESAGPILIVLLAVILYGPLLAGDLPINHDHPVMLLRAWVIGTQMLPSGSFTGFSLTLFAGHPANSLYSMGTDLLVCAVRYLSLGSLSWESAYCWALFLFVIAYPLALYSVGRRFAGPWAGVLAGLLGLVDRGFWFQSGWDFNLNWGVWSMGMSFTLCLVAIVCLDRLLDKYSPWNFCSTALSIGFAVLCHPMAVAILGIVLPLFVLVQVLAGRLGAPGLWIPRLVGAVATGIGLSAFWLIPFVSRQVWFEPLADPWVTFPDALIGLLNGSLLAQLSPVFLFAGILGLLIGICRRHPFSWFLLVTSGLLLFFSSNTFFVTFDVLDKFPGLSNLQPQRFAYFIRSALLIGCGLLLYQLVQLSRLGKTARPAGDSPLKRHGRRLLLALALSPFLVFFARIGPSAYLAPAKPLTWSSESDLYHDLHEAADFVNQLEPAAVDRVALVANTNEHLLLILPVLTGHNIFKVGFTPENNYRYKFESRDAAVLKAVNVSHVLSVGALLRSDLEEIKRFGRLRLYRFRDYSPDRLHLRGPGQATLERDQPEAMDIRLQGTRPESRLVVHRGRYALWRAELNGKPVPIAGASIGDTPEVFMELPVEDGLLTLRYRPGAPEILGILLSWISWLALLVIVLAARIPLVRSRLGKLGRVAGPVRDVVTLATLAVAAIGVIGVLVKLLLPASPALPGREVVSDLTERISQARGEVVRPSSSAPCGAWDGTRIKCPGPSWNFAGPVITTADHLLRKCIWLHPIQGAKFMLHFDGIELGDYIQGHCAIADLAAEPPSRHSVNLTVYLDGTELGHFTCPSRRGWFPWEVKTPGRSGTTGRVSVASDAPFTGKRHFCITAATTVDEN